MNTESVKNYALDLVEGLEHWAAASSFFPQLGLVVLAVVIAYVLATLLRRLAIFHSEPEQGPLYAVRNGLYQMRDLLFPAFIFLALAVMAGVSAHLVDQSWLMRMAENLVGVLLVYWVLSRFIANPVIKSLIKWITIPIIILQVVGLLDNVVGHLETWVLEIGNIRISAYSFVRALFFSAILFWLGRISNSTGQRVIRQQTHLAVGTREVFAKLYQVALVVLIFILLLQVMGINITALAVFGGALGVGLGFGLQSIASNFISGMILLLDRSLAVGDYIELDGHKGVIRELNMRSATLETFDGKDIMVPNEKFITSNFINWTHKNKKQRYSIEFQVAYSTDLHMLFDVLREVVASHPKVISGPDLPIEERPDAEICGFGDSGVDILVEFWMEGIDDGEHRVGGDLYLMIWDALKENNISIPFPQREIKILDGGEEGD